jgi:putative transposase
VAASAFETIVIEDLNVSGMSKNHALAGSVLDAAFGEIGRQLEYKTKRAGGRVVIADRFFPSSKTCSNCGHVVDALPLHVREWVCPVCGCVHDRDTNAAINLELVGRATPEPAQMPACGDMEALAVEQSATKLPWMNRKLDRRTHVRTN